MKFKLPVKIKNMETQTLREFYCSRGIIWAYVSIKFMMIEKKQDRLVFGKFLFMRGSNKENNFQEDGIMKDFRTWIISQGKWKWFISDFININFYFQKKFKNFWSTSLKLCFLNVFSILFWTQIFLTFLYIHKIINHKKSKIH